MQYSDVLAGNANPEKDAYIASEETRFEELYSKLDGYTDAFSQGQISQEAYSTLCSAIARQLDDEVVFQRAKSQYEQAKLQGYEYVCLTGYDRLFGPVGQQDLIMLAIKLMITLILGLSSIHSVETETNMILLLHSVPRHRDSIRIKGANASAYAVVAALITYIPHIFIIATKYGLDGAYASYHSVPQLTIGFHNVICTLLAYWIVLVSLSVIVSQVISWISGRAKHVISAILFSSTLLLPLFCCLLT